MSAENKSSWPKGTMSKTKRKKKSNAGRPSKKNEQIEGIVLKLAAQGKTEQQIADIIGIDKSTLTKWKQNDKEFFTSLKEARVEADDLVEAALFNRALGYSHKAVHISTYFGEVIQTEYIKHYPPSELACIYWLNNRRPEKWRQKVEGPIGQDPDTDAVFETQWSTSLPSEKPPSEK